MGPWATNSFMIAVPCIAWYLHMLQHLPYFSSPNMPNLPMAAHLSTKASVGVQHCHLCLKVAQVHLKGLAAMQKQLLRLKRHQSWHHKSVP